MEGAPAKTTGPGTHLGKNRMSDASLNSAGQASSDIGENLSDGGFSDFFALLKPRVMTLVVFTAFVGLYATPGGIHPLIGFIAILFIALDRMGGCDGRRQR
mgnify:CR=1 FL=1